MIVSIDNKKTNILTLIQSEIKRVKFTFTDENDTVIDVSSATLTFMVKTALGETSSLTVADGAMDKTSASTGIVYVPINTTTLAVAEYVAGLRAVFSATSIDQSGQIVLTLVQPVVE